ncbi:MAG: cupin [Clostridia bacterium]|jgi:ureidoglycolate hydrolase|nr:cupin [Clostridia bacterium]MBQ6120372.1 cupin [Clostridia bacterium]MBQ6326450.1 cupin [Clostridia bacterium]MBQ6346816.1 cupin [Clostridia bacterium]MBQ9039940.1 cupin [Clostridia bacterium]
MEILKYAFEGEGLTRVFENEKWMVGIKNWKPMNDIANINNLERHNETDELFILLNGQCTLLFANETADGLDIQAVEMEPMKVYNIPRTLWHNTVTRKDTKLALIEDSSTGSANSDNLDLTEAQIARVHELVKW